MNKVIIILLLVGSLIGPLFADAKPSVSEAIPGRTALREATLQNKLPQFKIERKIEHSDLVVSALLLSAEDALNKGDEQSAIAIAQKAILFSSESPLPHFFLSHVYGLSDKESILNALGEYATAIRLSIGNFWILTASLGIIGLTLMITFHLCLLTFLLYCFAYYTPIWVHYAKERLPANIRNNAIIVVMLFFALVLFFLLPYFWFIFISLFLFWFFYQPTEKILAATFLIGMIFSSFFLNPLLVMLTAKQSYLLDKMVANQGGEFLWSAPSFYEEETDWKVSFIKASYETQEHRIGGAEALYRHALLKNPDEKRILNNLANISFYRENFKEALAAYQKAINHDPDYVAAHYNMGQVYNEMLAFEKGKAKYLEAKKIDQSLTEHYAQLAASYPNYPVIEERLTQWELWEQLFLLYWNSEGRDNNILKLWIGGLSGIPFLILIIFVGGGGLLICGKLKGYVSGEFCPICHKTICIRCQESFTNYNLCQECGTDMITGATKKAGEIPKRMIPVLMIPGGFQMTLQKPILALSLLVPFCFCVILMLMGDVFLTSAHWHLSIANSNLLPGTIFFVYAVYLLDIYLRRRR